MTNAIRQAIIIGGGIGGLCAAIGLRQIGIEATVYEQAEALAPVGAGLVLWANAVRALRQLGLAERVIQAGTKIRRSELCAPAGKRLQRVQLGEFERQSGEPSLAVHRADLHRVLVSALPDGVLHLGMRGVRFEQANDRARIHFADGRSAQADLLIGADGIRSAIRQQLLPEVRLRYSGYTAWRAVVETPSELALGAASEVLGCGSRFGIVPLARQRVYWFATANVPPGQTRTAVELKDFLRRRFQGWHPPVEALIEATPADVILSNDIYDLKPLTGWSQGRVTLLGDAVHPTTPNLAQGAGMAIESAVVLARCLAQERELAAALGRYEAERRPRTAWITHQSWLLGRIGQLENRWLCTLRDWGIGLAPAGLMMKQLARIMDSEI